ncbi:DUF928 domain-containing protein [Oscillatoriales cyanobacterium LEGE 11467]|uniref:DUF928 domain-containing protein n=1 Tax=Zarconia navalis LEGE 11467 TaxID=1828826 RepID=A0A928VZ96_9CYAN|nr:DUF928 domain-containing protein [Zarconia navalis]MBE9040918.1 DUF928 domain-containing protein [Zarconia navalis LEGE 11467]
MKYLPLIRALGTMLLVAGITISNTGAVKAVTFETPDTPSPQRSSGGASRGSNSIRLRTTTQPSVLALLPQSDRGTTELERPTILLYLPETVGEEALFTMRDEEGNLHYQMKVPLSGNAGIVAIQLPEDAPALEIDRAYQWSFDLQDSDRVETRASRIRAWIERVEPNSSNGTEVWYDAVAALAQLRAAQPNNAALNHRWQELLGSVGLEELATAPIIEAR